MPRSKKKKDDQIAEMLIRGLLKQPENRRCINCNSPGPQYVCTTFWTFVCTDCSGVHREFSHRVKSVSMAKFKDDEIAALQAGGNERAKEIYFKTWDPQDSSVPDNRNLHRLREFIKQVYVDRRYAGANSSNSLPMINKPDKHLQDLRDGDNEPLSWTERNDFLRRFSLDRTGSGSRDRGSISMKKDKEMEIRNISEERNQRNIQENSKSGDNRSRRNISFEIVDDRFREDGSVKHYERHSSRSGSSSPASHKSSAANTPTIRPVKKNLVEKIPALRVDESPKASDEIDGPDSARGQKTADSNLPLPHVENKEQRKIVNHSSLTDFDAATESIQNTSEHQAEVAASPTGNESSSVAPSTTHTATDTQNLNPIESLLLLDWSDPVTPSDSMHADVIVAERNGSGATESGTEKALEDYNSPRAFAITVTNNNHLLNDKVTNNNHLLNDNVKDPMVQMDEIHQLPPNLEQQNQSSELAPSSAKSTPPEQSLQPVVSSNESPTCRRKELPQYLFTSHFNVFPTLNGGCQYGMQFQPPAMHVPAFMNPSRPRNPFVMADERFPAQGANHVPAFMNSSRPRNPFVMADERFPAQGANFSSTSPFQGALPGMSISAAYGSQTSPYTAPFASLLPQNGMIMPQGPGAYIGQLPNTVPPTRPQANAEFGRSIDTFASLNPIQQPRGIHSFSTAPKFPGSHGGNPFS